MSEKIALKWRSCDLKTVAFLRYAGFAIINIGKEQSRVYFDFEDTVERKSSLLSFWNREQRIEPIAFVDSMNQVRDMITQALRS